MAQNSDHYIVSGHAYDSVAGIYSNRSNNPKAYFPYHTLLLSGVLIGYGAVTVHNYELSKINTSIREEVFVDNPHKNFPLDNYLQFAPAAMVYGLNGFGIKGAHNFRDRSMIYLMSNLILNGTVRTVKALSNENRPDGADHYSFPSGHTAEAFASAEFLRMEYKDVSPWYGIAGYAMAATTGYLRMYNNRHWLSDVAAGAGVGILSTRLSYWLYPKIQHHLFKGKPDNTIVMPGYQNGVFQMAMIKQL